MSFYFMLRFSPRLCRAPDATKSYIGELRQCPVFSGLELDVFADLKPAGAGCSLLNFHY